MADDDDNELEESEDESEEEESDEDAEDEDDEDSEDDDGSEEGADDDDESDDDESDDDESDDDESDDDESDDDESDDDESDDEESDDEESDDEESDDEESDDEEASTDESDDDESDDDESDDDESSAKAKKTRARGKTGKRKQKRKSAAARLAAARAAKAARKAAKRGKERQDEKAPIEVISESQMAKKAQQAADWASQNRATAWAIAAVIVLAFAGGIAWYYQQKGQAEAGGAALAAAVAISNATIRAEGAEADPDDPPSYASVTERSEAALAAYEGVVSDFAGTETAAWAQLGRGQSLLDLGRPGDAREAFDAAIQASNGDGAILWRALEGKGFTHEAEEQWEQALEVYQELQRLEEGRFEPVAKYHIARMYIAQGQDQQATEALSTLVEELREAADDEERQEFTYVLAQAEVRLRELDPSAVPARPSLTNPLGSGGGAGPNPLGGGGNPLLGGGGAAGGDLSPEQIQRLIEQIQSKQGGAPPPGGE